MCEHSTIIAADTLFCCKYVFFFQAEDGIRVTSVTGVQTCALPICVAFSADGRRLATAELRGVVQVYALDIGDLLALARKRVTRPLTVSECRIYFQAETCPSLP